jgi:hypothetical protein|tara:strand:+ start:668 stop:982 length:315 start_codon:yes stop_codon:yes gene_type:complete
MKNKNNFRGVFWVGIIPISVIILIFMMLLFGLIIATTRNPSLGLHSKKLLKESHVCPKQEVIYIHDTIKIKVTHACNREHVSANTKPIEAGSTKDPNDTSKADH